MASLMTIIPHSILFVLEQLNTPSQHSITLNKHRIWQKIPRGQIINVKERELNAETI